MEKVKHLLYVPFTGLGLYGGYRGKRWLKNRITVFKNFVVPSLLNQTSQNYTLWVGWRPEERTNPLVKELYEYLKDKLDVVFTYNGLCFWDDKYPDNKAHFNLISNLHKTLAELVDVIGESQEVLMTIQPSDDCYDKNTVYAVQKFFEDNPDFNAIGYEKGYIMNYSTGEVSEYNPKTNPPFYTIRFPRDVFVDALQHARYTGPYKSHEYVPDYLNMGHFPDRGFLVGTHGENVSTYYDHPFRGQEVSQDLLKDFGLDQAELVHFKLGFKRWLLRKLPHPIRRKIRYWFGERLYGWWYEFIRS